MLRSRIAPCVGILAAATLWQCSLAVDLNSLDDLDGGLVEAGRAEAAPDASVFAETSVTDIGASADTNVESGGDAGTEAAGEAASGTPEGGSRADAEAGPDAASGFDGASDADGASSGDGATAPDSGGVTAGLIAYYPFDETSGTSASDASGNGHTATLIGGTGWAAGHRGGAVSLDGTSGYVRLPNGLLSTATDFTVATWVKLNSASAWARIFDFGTGTTAYMFLTCQISGGSGMRFSITNNGINGEEMINGPMFATGSWQHVAVTLAGRVGTLYVNGAAIATNAAMTLTASSLGSTTQTWIGRSEYAADPYGSGLWDEFRIYNRALSAGEVQTLAK